LFAAELEEGLRLNTSVAKQLSSTDEIYAEKKYKDPFSFTPCHTLILYTNHLPKVGANDPGTWRRLIVVPFSARIEGNGDHKNYADYLFENAGEAILTWIIEGAKAVIDAGFHIEQPECVKAATSAYRENSDWLGNFIDECCDIGDGYQCIVRRPLYPVQIFLSEGGRLHQKHHRFLYRDRVRRLYPQAHQKRAVRRRTAAQIGL
jgi:putative DNA primase/helicase